MDCPEVAPHSPLQGVIKKLKFDLIGDLEELFLEFLQNFDLFLDLAPVDMGVFGLGG